MIPINAVANAGSIASVVLIGMMIAISVNVMGILDAPNSISLLLVVSVVGMAVSVGAEMANTVVIDINMIVYADMSMS